ncbi:MAG: type II toxin-antitoxin system death-on-curing family toxin [Frankiaceae bacterium]|nr:type II toxin-antitoxin system death-on-curing family toxin [Frankiaceae bacterium]
MKYLSLADLMAAAASALDAPVAVRDWGLLESALARPRTSVFGEDAYVTVWDKAAALLHSLVRNHALVDGNKRLGITAAALLLHRNGIELTLDEDETYDLVIAVAEGRLDVPGIAESLHSWGA